MATDYSILEDELKNQLSDLKRDLHMRGVRTLANKQSGLAKMAVQRKQIELLKNQISELEPTVSMLYSAHHHLRDNQMKGYLIYLLQLKEYYAREVETKKKLFANEKNR
ncbi:hypothetical protein HNY73_003097 [Argiope bruennichi]|uniref:Uncharacterized protein n=1 Tax=Argiope bruennichi TaxID=94029 RepID=A0A8T0FVU2_ARGBR|nr:hypothetical protein HNY73_003097 [Argiope bruennichi]